MRKVDYIHISVTTYPARYDSFLKSFDSIYDPSKYEYTINLQLGALGAGDDLFFTPKLLDRYDSDNVTINEIPQEASRGDICKFFPLLSETTCNGTPDYALTIDDDIIYPQDYVERMVATCKYHGGIPVGVHAAMIYSKDTPIRNYFQERQVTHFASNSKRKFVNCLGTGTLCYSPQVVPISLDCFDKPNMADCYFAVYCQQNNIPMLCIDRDINWLIEITSNAPTLWSQRGDGKPQTEVINRIKRWKVFKKESVNAGN